MLVVLPPAPRSHLPYSQGTRREQDCAWTSSVSYTHLDVYKRQELLFMQTFDASLADEKSVDLGRVLFRENRAGRIEQSAAGL